MESTLRVVFVSSPYRGDVASNLALARAAAHEVFEAGHVPIVAHMYIPQVLDDDDPVERALGIGAALVLLARCDEIWVFGEPSEGMRMEIDEARRLGVPVDHRPLPIPVVDADRPR
jgi:hypothetical protein